MVASYELKILFLFSFPDVKEKMNDSDDISLSNNKETQQKKSDRLGDKKEPKQPSPSIDEEKSVIRTTTELERNASETSANLIPSSLNDVMVKDQSSTKPHETPTTAGTVSRTTTSRQEPLTNSSRSIFGGKNADKDNVIDTKNPEEDEPQNKGEENAPEVFDGKTLLNMKNKTVNEVLSISSDLGQTVNEIKLGTSNEDHKINLTTSSTPPPQLESEDLTKALSEVHDSDSAPKDGFLEGVGDDVKSEEDSEEDEKPKRTTIPPKVEHFETTSIPDLEEEEGENDREDEELTAITDKLPKNQSTVTNATRSTETQVQIKPTAPSLPGTYENSTVTYVTSLDIIPKDNSTQEETKTPLAGDINWYSVDTKPVLNVSNDETVAVTTTASIETTIEPDMTTEMSMLETTLPPKTTKTGEFCYSLLY